jgi:hypothetical protein
MCQISFYENILIALVSQLINSLLLNSTILCNNLVQNLGIEPRFPRPQIEVLTPDSLASVIAKPALHNYLCLVAMDDLLHNINE